MSVLHLALAGDPTTPRHVLAELVQDTMTHPGAYYAYVPDMLTVHPTLTDDDLPTHAAPDEPRYVELDVETLHHALTQPHATPTTRARLLTRTTTRVLLTYAHDTADPHPDALPELARRGPTGDGELDRQVDGLLALDPDTPDDRRLAALSACLRTPVVHVGALSLLAGIPAGDLHPLLTTLALRYPDQLRTLAGQTLETRARAALQRHADRIDAGIDTLTDLLADTRAHAATQTTSDPRAWASAINRTGDPGIAAAGLDLAGQAAGLAADATLNHPALARTPVRRRARIYRMTGRDAAATAIATAHDELETLIRHVAHTGTAHDLATKVPAHDSPTNQRALLAGWARLHHDADLNAPISRAALAGTSAIQVLRYATHPALPEPHRRAAVHHFTGANTTTFTTPPARKHLANLTYLRDHAATVDQLRTALLDMPVPDLLSTCDEDWDLEQNLAHHLAHALRPHHPVLTPTATRTLLSLLHTFAGSTRELLATATSITS